MWKWGLAIRFKCSLTVLGVKRPLVVMGLITIFSRRTLRLMLIRRTFIAFLLVLLPLQFAQAAVCSYGHSEINTSSQHGINATEETSVVAMNPHTHNQPEKSSCNECSVCHLCCTKFVRLQSEFTTIPCFVAISSPEVSYRYPLIISGIERPNWQFAV